MEENKQTTEPTALNKRVEIGQDLAYHDHDGTNSAKLKARNVIPYFTFTTTQLTDYLAAPALEGDEFNVYNSTTGVTNKYVRMNGAWTVVGTQPYFYANNISTSGNGTSTITCGFTPKLIKAMAFASATSPASNMGFSSGHWTDGGQECISRYGTTTRLYSGQMIRCYDDAATNGGTGTVGNITSTGFDIVFAQAGTGQWTVSYEVFG